MVYQSWWFRSAFDVQNLNKGILTYFIHLHAKIVVSFRETRNITSSGSKKETKGSHGPLRQETTINKAPKYFYKAPKLLILCLFNPTVKGTLMQG